MQNQIWDTMGQGRHQMLWHVYAKPTSWEKEDIKFDDNCMRNQHFGTREPSNLAYMQNQHFGTQETFNLMTDYMQNKTFRIRETSNLMTVICETSMPGDRRHQIWWQGYAKPTLWETRGIKFDDSCMENQHFGTREISNVMTVVCETKILSKTSILKIVFQKAVCRIYAQRKVL